MVVSHSATLHALGSSCSPCHGVSDYAYRPWLPLLSTPPAHPPQQGGGKRKGAFAVYLEPWHADIFDWLDLRKNHGKEEARARDLFYGLWINDLFME